jgi:hypothetical protein
MQLETDLCLAAGIDVARLAPIDVYLLGGKIINDWELTRKALALPRDSAVLGSNARKFVLNAMPASDRAALRDRILGITPIRR